MTTETTETTKTETPAPKKRGFASMTPERIREISSRGGKAAHEQGRAHTFSSEEARAAGSKGGKAPHIRRGRRPAEG